MNHGFKRITAFLLVLAMMGTFIIMPASAEAEITVLNERFSGKPLLSGITTLNKYDNTSGGETNVAVTKNLEYAVGGKLPEDDSAHIILSAMTAGEDFSKCDSHKQYYHYTTKNYAKTGYVVMEANVLPKDLNIGNFTVLTADNYSIAQNKNPADIGIIPGQWNNIRMVVNMNTASLDAAPYRYPDVTAYINGVAYDMSKGTSSGAITSYNPGRLIFMGESAYEYDQDIYWDDCITYLTTEDPGAPAMPALEANSGFTLSGSDITLKGDVNISDLEATAGCNIRVYDDSSMSSPLDGNVNLAVGNIIVAADDAENLYTTYTVNEYLLAYMNGNTMYGMSDITRGAGVAVSGFAGSAGGDISIHFDAARGNYEKTGGLRDAIYWQYNYKEMTDSTAKYLVVETEFYPDSSTYGTADDGTEYLPFNELTLKSNAYHVSVTPRLIADSAEPSGTDLAYLRMNSWNKVVWVIKNVYATGEAEYVSGKVTEAVAKAGKHKVTIFVNGTEVVSDAIMPYWGMDWSARGMNKNLRIGHWTAGDTYNGSITAYDNLRVYETDSFDKAAYANMPSLTENPDVHYAIEKNTLKIYDEFAVRLSDLNTLSPASVRAYTDGTLANELSDGASLGEGNVVAVADTDSVTYYDVISVTSAQAVLAAADTAAEWAALAPGGTTVDDVMGKTSSDGAHMLSADGDNSISCWRGYDGSGILVTELNAYAPGDTAIALRAGDITLGTATLAGGRWSRIALIADSSAKTVQLCVNGEEINYLTGSDIDYASSALEISAESNVYTDNLRSYVTALSGTVKYDPGRIYENENIIINGDTAKIKANSIKVSDLPCDGEAVVYRNGAIAGSDEYLTAGDIVFVDKDSHIGTYPVEGFTLDYEFANSDSGCAKGTMSIDLADKFDYTLVDLYWAAADGGSVMPLADYLPIKSFTGADLRKGYTITKDMFIPQAAEYLLARYYYNNTEIDFTYEIPASKRMTETEPDVIIALSSDYHFGTQTADKEPTSKHDMTLRHINSYADAVVVNGDITNWWGSHSKAQIDAYQANKGAVGGDWENDPSQFDVAREYFEQFTIPVYMVQGNHDVPETGRYNINSTYGATASWRYSEYLNNWIDYSIEKGYYEDAIEREVDETYTGPSDKSNLATFYDDYVRGYHLIFLRVPYESGGKAYYDLMQQELDFLDRKLYEMEESGKPIFVFSHVPIEDTIGRAQETWENSQVRQQAFKDILNKHPNAIVVSGHSHFGINNEWTWTINGRQEKPAFVHDGGIISQTTPVDENRSNDITSYDDASCVYAEIYSDRVVTRGYDLINEKWIPQGISQITRKAESTVGDIKVSKVERDGFVYLKAEGDADVSFEWTADGNSFSGDVLALNGDFDNFVAVRATNAQGDYKSTSFKNIDAIPAGEFDITDYDEGRTDYVSTESSADEYILNNGQENGVTIYETGIGGKNHDDESARMYIASGGRTWGAPVPGGTGAAKRNWKQANADSKYLVFSMNVMPASEDTVYALIGTNGGAAVTAKSTDNLNKYQWNKLVGVYNIETGLIDTYINGKLVSDDAAVSFTSGGDIRITFEGTTGFSTETSQLTGYADDVEIYETKNLPMLLWAQGLEDKDYGGGITVDNTAKAVYADPGITAAELGEILGVTVSGADGFTKASDSIVTAGDYAVAYDASADAYSYYEIKTYYTADFTSGVESGSITGSQVSLAIAAKSGGEQVIAAQYNGGGSLAKAELITLDKGRNQLTFAKADDAAEVKIMVWKNKNALAPIAGAVKLTVK